jgi:hypothetical protein
MKSGTAVSPVGRARGRGGSKGSVRRKYCSAATAGVPYTPYTGTLRSGTSSTYVYSSVAPLEGVMVPPTPTAAMVAAESVVVRLPYVSAKEKPEVMAGSAGA